MDRGKRVTESDLHLKNDSTYSLESVLQVVRLEVKETDEKVVAVIQTGNDEGSDS